MNISQTTQTLTEELHTKIYHMILEEIGATNIGRGLFTYGNRRFEFEIMPSTTWQSYYINNVYIDGKFQNLAKLPGFKGSKFQTTEALKKTLDKIVKLNYTKEMKLQDTLEPSTTSLIKNAQII